VSACVICGHDEAAHQGDGEMVHGFVDLDDQCPFTGRRCDRPCGDVCLRASDAYYAIPDGPR